MQVAMDNLEVAENRDFLWVDGSMLASNSFKESDNFGNDSAFYEKFLLDDLDSYWDDLNARLTVSRMVGDSVIKGMVNAVVQEAAEKIALKEAEIAALSERLRCSESGVAHGNRWELLMMVPSMMKLKPHKSAEELHEGSLDESLKSDCMERLFRLRTGVEELIERVSDDLEIIRSSKSGICRGIGQGKNNEEVLEINEKVDSLRRKIAAVFEQFNCMFYSLKVSLFDSEWENEFQKELNAIVVQNYIKSLHDEFENKVWEQRSLINIFSKKWQEKVDELSTMREELDVISASFLSSDPSSLSSQNSQEAQDYFEECTVKKRDWKVLGNHHLTNTEANGTQAMEKAGDSGKAMLEFADSPQLKGMTKEEVIAYCRSEMIKMRRQHDSALQEKTEELFRLKREFLKEKGSSHLRKDKELEVLRRKIPEVISKLDGILQEKGDFPVVHDDQLSCLKKRIDMLYFENQHLQGLVAEKRKEILYLSSKASHAADQMTLCSSLESYYLKQIKKIKSDLADLNIETNIRIELFNIIIKEFIAQHRYSTVDFEIEMEIAQDICSIIFKAVTDDTMSALDTTILRHQIEISLLKQEIFDKEKEICSVTEENKKLKQVVASLSAVMEEKEKLELETGSTLNQQKVRFDFVYQELCMLKEKVREQEILILEKMTELDSVKSSLNEALMQNDSYEMQISNLNQKIKNTLDALEDAKKQNNMLCRVIEDKRKMLSSSLNIEAKQEKQMGYIIDSLNKLLEAIPDVENRLAKNIEQNEYRLTVLNDKWNSLVWNAGISKKKEMWYKQILEIRCVNLQKAEAEVDLLGDEVDALLNLLGKIYIALDHYSPVLQHYPGVMEILKLVQRELKGENTKL